MRFEEYRQIFETAPDPIFIADSMQPKGCLIDVNQKMRALTGYTKEELLEMGLADLFPKESHDTIRKVFKGQVRGEIKEAQDLPICKKNGEIVYVNVSVNIIERDEERLVFGILRDVTEKRQLEELRSDFLHMVIHDTRGPLCTIQLAADTLWHQLKEIVGSEHKKILEMMNKNAQVLIDLTNDLLDLSKIEAGMFKLDIKKIKPKEYLDEILEEMLLLAEHKNISLDISLPEKPPLIKADPLKLHQIFNNLIGNAIKFTPAGGGIRITVTPKKGFVQFEVQDTGCGIPRKEQKTIFNKYHQFLTKKDKAIKGTGLGLAISKLLIEAHGGKIWVKSVPGKGSSFIFTLPKEPALTNS
ncbi:MAG: PAS domain-containing sensor histidine kinase [Candidatus Saganbacteria bacterium]|nr:PAS domain-containing sensor histidine kinase [Candidatus Saganbacteria bacterium]